MSGAPDIAGIEAALDELLAAGPPPGKAESRTDRIKALAPKIDRLKKSGWSWQQIADSLAKVGLKASVATIRLAVSEVVPRSKRKGRAAASKAPAKSAARPERKSPATAPTAAATAPTEPPAPPPGKAPESNLDEHAASRRALRKP